MVRPLCAVTAGENLVDEAAVCHPSQVSFSDAAKAKSDWNQDPPMLPTMPSTASALEDKITGIVVKLDKLPYEAIGAGTTRALASLNTTLQDTTNVLKRFDADVTPELKATLDDARTLLATADGMLKNAVSTTLTGVNTTLTGLNTTLEDLRCPLATARHVAQG